MIAFHFNKPVLATDVGGLSDYIKNKQNGYIIDPNPQAIVDSLLDYFDYNRELNFKEEIKQTKKQYSWSKLVDKFEDIFK